MTRARRRQILLALLPAAGLPGIAQARGGRGTVRLYRANGRYAGRIEANGRYYGENGRYLGRVEGNRIYSAQGRYLGRFEESGVFHDAAAASGSAGRASGDRGDDLRSGAPDRDTAAAPPSVAHEVRPLPEDATLRLPSPAEGPAPMAGGSGARPLPPVTAHPPPAFVADPSAGQPLIEIIRPERGPR